MDLVDFLLFPVSFLHFEEVCRCSLCDADSDEQQLRPEHVSLQEGCESLCSR